MTWGRMLRRALRPWSGRDFWERKFLQEVTPWDLGEPSPTLVELEKIAELPTRASVFVPGCGRGHDVLHFARLGYDVSAVDWSSTAITELRTLAQREKLEVELLVSDVWKIPTSWYKEFDVWVEHTFFCAIDPSDRKKYVQQALNLLKPEGRLIGSFFVYEDVLGPKPPRYSIKPESDGPPFWTTEQELRDLFSPHFEILRLERSPFIHASAGVREWWVDLRLRPSMESAG